MKIWIRFENSLMDMNYTGLDWVKALRDDPNSITYDKMEKDGVEWIWEWDRLTVKEKRKARLRKEDWSFEMTLPPFAKKELKKSLEEGDQLAVVSSSEDERWIRKILDKNGLPSKDIGIITGVKDDNLADMLSDNGVDIYIEDRGYRIEDMTSKGVDVVVRDYPHNERYRRTKRLECFSQWRDMKKWKRKKDERTK